VIERTYADALGVRAGDRITLNGRPFTVSGIAVTAASAPYPNLCYAGCAYSLSRRGRTGGRMAGEIAILVTSLVAVLAFHATAGQLRFRGPSGMSDPVIDRDSQVLLVITVVLVILAAINAIFTAWTTALDARHQLAVARSLGATPQQVSAGLSAAQLLAAVPGAIVGIPAGIALFLAASHAGTVTIPPVGWLLATVLGTLLVLAGLTTIPARIAARRPVAEILQSETA
jgi:putative ABC transport system permease protein